MKMVPITEMVDIKDNLRKPINNSERQKRIRGKSTDELFPYFGATGQVGFIDDFLTDGEYVLVGEDGAPFLDFGRDKAYIISGKSWVNNHAHILQAKQNIATNRFILHYLNYFNYSDFVNGTTRLKLTKGSLQSFQIPAFSLKEQNKTTNRIEKLFSEVVVASANLSEAHLKLDMYKNSVLNSYLRGRIGSSERSSKQYERQLYNHLASISKDKFQKILEDEVPFTAPSGWTWVRLGELIKEGPTNGLYKPKTAYGTGTPIIRIDSYYEGELISWNSLKRLRLTKEELNQYRLKINDVVLNRVNSIEYLGKSVCINELCEDVVYESNMMKFSIFENIVDVNYLVLYLNSAYGLSSLRSNAKHAVNQASINQEDVKQSHVLLPPLDIQRKINERFKLQKNVSSELKTEIDQNTNSIKILKHSILKNAFEGKYI